MFYLILAGGLVSAVISVRARDADLRFCASLAAGGALALALMFWGQW